MAFVSADNPHGQAVGGAANLAARAELAAFLDAEGLTWHPAVGGDPAGRHNEPGAAVLGHDLRSAAALGARFAQAAVYLWTPGALHLVACATARHDVLGYRASAGTDLRRPLLRPPAPR